MIVPMKKATLIVQAKDADGALRKLRSLGVLHVEHITPPQGIDINSLKDDISLADSALRILSSPEFAKTVPFENGRHVKDWKAAARHVVDMWKRLDQLEEYSRNLKVAIKTWERWGDFDPESIGKLGAGNIFVRLYEVPSARLKELPAEFIVKKIFASSGITGIAVVSRDDKAKLPFKEIELPRSSLASMKAHLGEDEHMMRAIRHNTVRHLSYKDTFIRIKRSLAKELKVHEALRGMGQSGTLTYISGYIPEDAVSGLMAASKEEQWGISVRNPSRDDNVPTLVRNPRWISVIEPVFKLLEILPGYKELDTSPLFLLFLGLFFGMIIGDAGYGALYMLLTFLAEIKFGGRAKDKKIFFLLYFFSACAIFWGVITGTIFGQEWYVRAGFKPLMPVLNDTKFIQGLCFFIGAFHLTLAHMWQAARKLPSLTAIADAGWIAVLWSAFFFAKTLILSDPLPAFVKYSLLGGVSLVIFFTNPQKNIIKAMAEGLGTVALSIMNNFTDVVSYVRLFAVGLAGVAISDTVNTLASVFGGENILIKILIIFMGHTINIVLGPISVLVHGIRLNVLEFSGHAGLTWSGIPYRPLGSAKE